MTYQLTVLYHHPQDVDAFDRYYEETHAPLAAKLPGLRSYAVCRPEPDADGKRSPGHLIAVLTWDSEEAYQTAFASAEGQPTVADLSNFAAAGVQLISGPQQIDRLATRRRCLKQKLIAPKCSSR